eukprot:SAG11_NODE_410_length_9703_cov_3.284777_12_plen_76_part_00
MYSSKSALSPRMALSRMSQAYCSEVRDILAGSCLTLAAIVSETSPHSLAAHSPARIGFSHRCGCGSGGGVGNARP